MTARDPEYLLEGLDPEQRDVATTLGVPVAVIAGAGTGKTRAITHRIAYAVATKEAEARAVLAVTFTTRAAGELRDRLHRLGIEGVSARTFHSAALRQAQYFWPKAYGTELPAVSDGQFGMLSAAAGRLGVPTDVAVVRDLAAEVSWAKVSNILPESYAPLARTKGRSVGSLEPELVARVMSAYEDVKRERGVIDLDDILLCTVALLSEHEPAAAEVRRTYRHFVVDEYQDVSPIQQRLLELWRGTSQDLCVVGDAAQTIHSFAGARPDYLTDFSSRFPGASVLRLNRDYRSTPQVVQLANHVIAGSPGAVELRAQQPPGPPVAFVEAAHEAAEAAGVADWLASLAAAGVAQRNMAVLYRINAQSPILEAALAERGIGYQVRGGDRYYDRPEVRQALAALKSASREDPDAEAGSAALGVLQALGWTEQAPAGAGRVRERWESQAALVELAKSYVDEHPGAGLADLVAELQRRAEIEHAPGASGVTLATLHSAKGLEWDAVALYGMHEGGLPFVLATSPEQLAEERRLLYVGVTRARTHLRVSWSRGRTGTQGNRGPSRFLAGVAPIGGATKRAAEGRKRAKSRETLLSARCRVCGLDLAAGPERNLGRHTTCESSYDEATMAALKAWRKLQADEQRAPAYVVFTDATLTAIAEARPKDRRDLARISGIGAVKLDRYGDAVLAVLRGEVPEVVRLETA